MTDKKITQLTVINQIDNDDFIPVVINPSTVPENRALTVSGLFFGRTFTPVAHADSHKVGGSDQIATLTPAAYQIPRADSNGKIDNGWLNIKDGWLSAEETWTYVSSTQFSVVGDKTPAYTPGVKIRMYNGGTKYFYVANSSYSAPNTVVTVNGGTDYSLTNTSIIDNFIGFTPKPEGFPEWFDYNCIWSSVSNPQPVLSNGTQAHAFKMDGSWVTVTGRLTMGTLSTYGTGNWAFSMPVPLLTSSPTRTFYGFGYIRDGGIANYFYFVQVSTDDLANIKYFMVTTAGSNASLLNSTTPIAWGNGDSVNWNYSYRVS